MEFWSFFWDNENDPDGSVEHIAEHDLTVADVEHVLKNPTAEGTSKSTGFPAVWGYTPDGRFIIVVYEEVAAHIHGLRSSGAQREKEKIIWPERFGNGSFDGGS
jgi:hypothetical protein